MYKRAAYMEYKFCSVKAAQVGRSRTGITNNIALRKPLLGGYKLRPIIALFRSILRNI